MLTGKANASHELGTRNCIRLKEYTIKVVY